jgi:hypothetical protein
MAANYGWNTGPESTILLASGTRNWCYRSNYQTPMEERHLKNWLNCPPLHLLNGWTIRGGVTKSPVGVQEQNPLLY